MKYMHDSWRPPSTFLKSVLGLSSEFAPQTYALFLQGIELKTKLSDLKILVMAGPGPIVSGLCLSSLHGHGFNNFFIFNVLKTTN